MLLFEDKFNTVCLFFWFLYVCQKYMFNLWLGDLKGRVSLKIKHLHINLNFIATEKNALVERIDNF